MAYPFHVRIIPATTARHNPDQLIAEVSAIGDAVRIGGPRAAAVLVSEDDWRAIQEALHLLSMPGMRESILEGMATDIEECDDDPGW